MNQNLQNLLEKVVLNEEISLSTRLNALDQINELNTQLDEPSQAVTDFLRGKLKTNSKVTNQLAQSALEWLEEKSHE